MYLALFTCNFHMLSFRLFRSIVSSPLVTRTSRLTPRAHVWSRNPIFLSTYSPSSLLTSSPTKFSTFSPNRSDKQYNLTSPRNDSAKEEETTASQALPGRVEPRLSITFTCTVADCGERSTHEFSKQAYTKGIVLAQCPRCKNRYVRSII